MVEITTPPKGQIQGYGMDTTRQLSVALSATGEIPGSGRDTALIQTSSAIDKIPGSDPDADVPPSMTMAPPICSCPKDETH